MEGLERGGNIWLTICKLGIMEGIEGGGVKGLTKGRWGQWWTTGRWGQ